MMASKRFNEDRKLHLPATLMLTLLMLGACSANNGGVSVAALNDTPDINNLDAQLPRPEGLTATHRSGQTFLVWPETNENALYNVYRHDRPITQENLNDAVLLNNRWGLLDSNTSVNTLSTDEVPSHFVISDLSPQLSDDTGLFVYTIPNGENTSSYYAVTTVNNGSESTDLILGYNSLSSPVSEASARPKPVLTRSINNGKGRIYTQYMDYNNWNPTLNGYAYTYAVSLPHNYNQNTSYPLQLHLHAFGDSYGFRSETEYEWEFIKLSPIDPGQSQNTLHTWWYGFAANHNYATSGNTPLDGVIENFTEQRVLASVQDLILDNAININSDLIHIVGHSMGASGALALGLRYPEIFSGIYASQPMTNYKSSPTFQSNFTQLWGEQGSNLPIRNNGTFSGPIARYGIDGSAPTGVWDWMNHIEQITRRKSEQFAYLLIDHGKADSVIDWNTQGRPLAETLYDAKVGFSANAFAGADHSWQGFRAVPTQLFGLGYDGNAPWKYPNSLSFPAISNASGSSSSNPVSNGDSNFNTNIDWSTSGNNFDRPIVDTENQYEISLRSTNGDQTANITPRNTQLFEPLPNQQCVWYSNSIETGRNLQSGVANADRYGLITIYGTTILAGDGTRLAIQC